MLVTSFSISTMATSPTTCSLLANMKESSAFRWEADQNRCLLAQADITNLVKSNGNEDELVYVCQIG